MKKIIEIYCKIDDVIEKIVKWFCAILLFIMICVCFVNTVSRYAFHHSFRAAEEIVILCAVWVTCVGASLTAREDDHVTLDLLQELIKSHKVRAVLYAVTPQQLLPDRAAACGLQNDQDLCPHEADRHGLAAVGPVFFLRRRLHRHGARLYTHPAGQGQGAVERDRGKIGI